MTADEDASLLEECIQRVYTKFALHFYQEIFSRFQSREASLTAVEVLCMEIIQALKEPTINEFASFVRISSPNATYRVGSLMQKGYVEKVQSKEDHREYHLRPTQKYMDCYNISSRYVGEVASRAKTQFTEEESQEFERLLQEMSDALMPEVQLK